MNAIDVIRDRFLASRLPRLPLLSKIALSLLGIAFCSIASAAYNANIVGTPVAVLTYEGGELMFILDNQPTTHPACNPVFFAIDPPNNTDAAMARLYARLLVAYTQQQPVTVGYDNAGTCSTGGYMHVYRVG